MLNTWVIPNLEMSPWFSLCQRNQALCRVCLGLAKGCCVEQGTGGSWEHLPRDKISHTEHEPLVETKGRVIREDSAEVLLHFDMLHACCEKRARGRCVMGPENRTHLEDATVIPTCRWEPEKHLNSDWQTSGQSTPGLRKPRCLKPRQPP